MNITEYNDARNHFKVKETTLSKHKFMSIQCHIQGKCNEATCDRTGKLLSHERHKNNAKYMNRIT